MEMNQIYRCSQGCRKCPRMRGCLGGEDVPARAEDLPSEQTSEAVPTGSFDAVPAASVPAETVQESETVLPQDAPEAEGVGEPALDTPEDTVPEEVGMEQYLEENCEQGILRIQAFRGQQAIPVEGADITVRCPIGGDKMVFFQGRTDASGVIDPILLPAPKPETSLSPGMSNPCSEYEIIAEHPEFETLTTKVMVFPGIKTIQPLQMNLKAV